MKKIALIIFLISTQLSFTQKVITKKGNITFEASVPAFEEVKATNNNVSCVLNTQTGEIASLALIKGFRFKIALMEEHFNENYIESTKYPKAIFKGQIENFDIIKLTDKNQNYTIKGTLELHGKIKNITSSAKIKKTEKGIEIENNFEVNSDDFDIKIPNMVSKKVSKNVEVNCSFTFL
jgi:hypothetical protein